MNNKIIFYRSFKINKILHSLQFNLKYYWQIILYLTNCIHHALMTATLHLVLFPLTFRAIWWPVLVVTYINSVIMLDLNLLRIRFIKELIMVWFNMILTHMYRFVNKALLFTYICIIMYL